MWTSRRKEAVLLKDLKLRKKGEKGTFKVTSPEI
jgi:hypothetical protein